MYRDMTRPCQIDMSVTPWASANAEGPGADLLPLLLDVEPQTVRPTAVAAINVMARSLFFMVVSLDEGVR
jgi:hypothetical protein